jgi:DNA-binding NarL/FixJ family response regulator
VLSTFPAPGGQARPPDLVGRDRELAAIDLLIDDRRPVAMAVLLDGEAGIGKTSLWRAGRTRATEAGLRVLAAELGERETDLPLVGLVLLLGPIDAAIAEPIDALAIGRAVVAQLDSLAAVGPVVIAIDDVQWLDPVSEHVLTFAIRRLADRPMRVLLTRRTDRDEAPPFGLDRALPIERLNRIRLQSLGPSDLDGLLRARLDVRLPRPRLVELHAIANGNPFHALEIVQAVLRTGRPLGDEAFVVPASLADVVRSGIDGLSAAGRHAVLLAATAGTVPADLLEAAAGGRAGISEAVADGSLELDDARVRVRHPLLASVVYDSALPSERREAHRGLADVASDPIDRARHRALATTGVDEAVAAELEASADAAARRGAPALGAFLAEQSARLTPRSDAAASRRRRRTGAMHRISAGDPAAARGVLERLAEETDQGPERAVTLLYLADTVGDDLERSIALAEQALAEAGDDPALGAQIHTALGVFTWLAGDLARATDHCLASAELAEASGDEHLVAISLGELCHAEAVLGRPWSRAAMERALELERRLDQFPPWLRPSFQLGIILTYTDRPDEARPLVMAELDRVTALGDEAARVGVLFRLAELELRAGNWGPASETAREAMALGAQAGIEQEQTTGLMVHALMTAHLGALDAARQAASRSLAVATEMGDRIVATRARGVLGLIEMSAGRPVEALASLEPAMDDLRRMGIGELSIAAVPENLVEALIAVGRLDEAAALCDETEERGLPADRAWHAAIASRGRALIAAARGEHEAARRAIADAYDAHARLPNPFTLGRMHLAAGIAARRARRWAEARRAFTDALEVFDRLGAARWAERAATELGRLPGRPPAGEGLTETERAIATLVAAGLPNKALAGRLSVTTRTVEQRVSRIYQKLGVASRSELARSFDPDAREAGRSGSDA